MVMILVFIHSQTIILLEQLQIQSQLLQQQQQQIDDLMRQNKDGKYISFYTLANYNTFFWQVQR